MQNTIRAVVVPADDEAPIRFVVMEPTLEGFRAHLNGGDLEALGLGYADLPGTMYLDEEGKLKGLPVNRFANALAPLRGDVFVGPVVYVGGVDDEGYDTSVPEQLVELILLTTAQVGRVVAVG